MGYYWRVIVAVSFILNILITCRSKAMVLNPVILHLESGIAIMHWPPLLHPTACASGGHGGGYCLGMVQRRLPTNDSPLWPWPQGLRHRLPPPPLHLLCLPSHRRTQSTTQSLYVTTCVSECPTEKDNNIKCKPNSLVKSCWPRESNKNE